MGFPTKVQLIKRKSSEQWYINFPSALAQAMDFSRGETVEWTVEDKSLLALRRLRPPASYAKKNSSGILSAFQQLWSECLPAFDQQRVAERAETLALSSLLCLGRHTVTGLLTTCGLEFQDWSAEYRLFSRHRWPAAAVFAVIRRAVLAELPPEAPFCVAIDDSLLPKTGIRIPGVAWRRDPLGPHFQTNFVRAQRVLQFSASLPLSNGAYRMVPIAFQHAAHSRQALPKASPGEWETVSPCRPPGAHPATGLPADRRTASGSGRRTQRFPTSPLPFCRWRLHQCDGFEETPSRTTLVGRIRKDAKLYFSPEPPQAAPQRGRPRRYGAPAPTPSSCAR